MYFFKSCSKCQGDMKLGNDIEGDWFVHCLNCGYTVDLPRRGRLANDFLSRKAS